MAVLNAKQRRKSATIKPSSSYPSGRFPMPDKAHARNALARLNQAHGLTELQKAHIRARARRILSGK